MSIVSGEFLFHLVVWMIAAFWVVVGFMLTLHFFMPKAILEKYFKPPYFKEGETKLFTGIPYAPIRTIMFMTVIAFPRRGKKRGLTQAYMLAPKWYILASKTIIFGLISTGVSTIAILLGFFVYFI